MNENIFIRKVAQIIEGITEGNMTLVEQLLSEISGDEFYNEDYKKLFGALKSLGEKQRESNDFILSLSRGELELDPPRHNQSISPLKELHSNLCNMVWQVGKFASGNYNQKIEFSGTITESFHRLSQSLKDKEFIQKALRESEALYRVTLNASPDGIVLTDTEGMITMVSPSALQMLRHDSEENLLGETIISLINPEYRYSFQSDTSKLLKGEKSQIREYAALRSDGTVFDIEMTGALIRDEKGGASGIVFDFRDISERNITELKLRESENRYRLLVETANEGVIVAQDGQLKFVNPKMIEISGYSKDELLSSPFIDFVYPDDRNIVMGNYLKRLNSGHADPRYQFRILTKDSQIRWAEVSGATIEWEGKSATFNFLTDITERKITEQEVNLKNDQLIRLNAEKDKLFSIIAHDLRGPFSSFMDYTEIMVEDLYDMSIQEIQEMAGEMKKSSYNLYTLLENLLEWSRVQSGITSYVHSVFELKPMITDTMALVVQAAAKKEIEITLEIPEYIKVDADENMLKSIVRNLASNAVKFTRRGGKITLEATLLNEGFVEIRIKDSGIGMNAGIIEKLFTLNKKISRNGTEGELSTGLGLLLCKDFVEKHGGRIWADSVEGRGSIFHFTIPSA
jgi:hypothetical protein